MGLFLFAKSCLFRVYGLQFLLIDLVCIFLFLSHGFGSVDPVDGRDCRFHDHVLKDWSLSQELLIVRKLEGVIWTRELEFFV